MDFLSFKVDDMTEIITYPHTRVAKIQQIWTHI